MGRTLFALLVGLAAVIWGGWFAAERIDALYFRSPVEGKRLPATPRPVRVDAEALATLLEESTYVSPGLEGRVLWKIGFRACSDCIAFKRTTFPALHAANVDTRVILYAPRSGKYDAGPEEQAVLADLMRTRDWATYEAWYAVAPGAYYANVDLPGAVAGDVAREARIAEGRATHDAIAAILAKNGWDMERPAFFWRDETGRLMTFMGDTPRGRALVAKALGAKSPAAQ